jgi:hypothetical protein
MPGTCVAMQRLLILLTAVLLLAACGGNQSTRERQEAMDMWSNCVRWCEEVDALLDFIHPQWLAENPIRELDIERLRQFRVTEYRIRQVLAEPDGMGVQRVARIRLYHVHTSRERVIDYREIWRYDSDLKAWLMHSGLPDPRCH